MSGTFPVFRVATSGLAGSSGVAGTVTGTTHGREKLIDDRWLGYLMAGVLLIPGRWHRRGDLWDFVPDDPTGVVTLLARAEWDVLDVYWGDRADIVLDETRHWERAHYHATDALRIVRPRGVWHRPVDESGVSASSADPDDADFTELSGVVLEAWDHEHCAICWETLGTGGQAKGYVSAQRNWVCVKCYLDFVEPRSLGFIPSA